VRFIPINYILFEEFLKLRIRNGRGSFLFVNPQTEKPFTRIYKSFKSACERAGIEGLRFHDLRHTFATRLVEKGVDIETVKELLGHYGISITQRYTHSSDERKKKAVGLLVKSAKNEGTSDTPLTHEEKEPSEQNFQKPIRCLFSVN
jgi:integrase